MLAAPRCGRPSPQPKIRAGLITERPGIGSWVTPGHACGSRREKSYPRLCFGWGLLRRCALKAPLGLSLKVRDTGTYLTSEAPGGPGRAWKWKPRWLAVPPQAENLQAVDWARSDPTTKPANLDLYKKQLSSASTAKSTTEASKWESGLVSVPVSSKI